MIFAYGIIYILSAALGWKLPGIWMVVFAITPGVADIIFNKTDKHRLVLRIAGGGMAAALVVVFLINGRLIPYIKGMAAYYANFSITGSLNMHYGWPLVLAVTFAMYIIYTLAGRSRYAKTVLSMLIIGGLIAGTVNGLKWSLMPVAALLFVAAEGLFQVYLQWKKPESTYKVWKKYIFTAAVLLLAIILPDSNKPISWKGVINAWNNIKSGINELVCDIVYGDADQIFGVGNIGFSGQDSGFWGKLVDSSNREMLRVTVTSGPVSNLYMVCTTRDIYENNGWSEIPDKDYTGGYEKELDVKLYNLYRAGIPSDENEYFCKQSRSTVEYRNLHTDSVFVPTDCIDIQPIRVRGSLYEESGNVFFSKKQRKENKYSVGGLIMNMNNPMLTQYLRGGSVEAEGGETVFDECVKVLGLSDEAVGELTGNSMRTEAAEYEKYVESVDLQLSDDISQEVYELADSITAGCTSDYDRVMAIEQYLSRDGGYVYTLSPETPPEGVDQTVYFILESHGGYCVHYASAVALLCRCVGIPVRYAEGTVVGSREEGESYSKVLGRDSHAWAQAYIRGFGWIDVDATPGYSTSTGNFKRPDTGHQSEYRPEIPTGSNSSNDNNTDIADNTASESLSWRQVLVYVLLAAGAAAVAGGIAVVCIILVKRYRYNHSDNRQKCEWHMRRLMKRLRGMKLGIEEGETLRKYSERLIKNQAPEYARVMLWYEGVRYGGVKVSEDDLNMLRNIQ